MDQYQWETFEELSSPLVHTNFPRKRYGPMIGPYEFPPKLVWTNGAQSSLKLSVLWKLQSSIDSQLPSWKSFELIFPKLPLPLPLPSWNVFEWFMFSLLIMVFSMKLCFAQSTCHRLVASSPSWADMCWIAFHSSDMILLCWRNAIFGGRSTLLQWFCPLLLHEWGSVANGHKRPPHWH